MTIPTTGLHIHRAPTTSASPIVVPFSNPTSNQTYQCVTADEALLDDIAASPGNYYVNLHTQPTQTASTAPPSSPRSHRAHPHTNTYALTPDGIRVAVVYSKLDRRLLHPLLSADRPPGPIEVRRALATIDVLG